MMTTTATIIVIINHDYGHNNDRREALDVSVCWFHLFFS